MNTKKIMVSVSVEEIPPADRDQGIEVEFWLSSGHPLSEGQNSTKSPELFQMPASDDRWLSRHRVPTVKTGLGPEVSRHPMLVRAARYLLRLASA